MCGSRYRLSEFPAGALSGSPCAAPQAQCDRRPTTNEKNFVACRILLPAVSLAFTAGQTIAAGSGIADMHAKQPLETRRRRGDIHHVDWIASYEGGPSGTAYHAQTAYDAPLHDPYVIPGSRIRAIVRVRYDMTVLDRVDLVFTDLPGHNLVVVHTTVGNAGIRRDIYQLRHLPACVPAREGNRQPPPDR